MMQTTHTRSYHSRKITALTVLIALLGWSLVTISPTARAYSGKAVASVKAAIGRVGSPLAPASRVAKDEVKTSFGVQPDNGPNVASKLPAAAAGAITGELEPNGTSATATAINAATAKISANLSASSPSTADFDFYSFSATAGDRVFAAQTLIALASGGIVLELLAPDGTTVLESDNNDGNSLTSSSRIKGFLIPSPGTYFLRVRQNSATNTSISYNLYFNRWSSVAAATAQSDDMPDTSNLLSSERSVVPGKLAIKTASFTEGFEGVAFPPTGWEAINHSTTIGTNTQCWNRFTATPWAPHAGGGHSGANFNCTTGNNTISGWLLAPEIMPLHNGDQISFWTRKASPDSFPDRLELRLSTNGASNNVGTTSTDVGDFSTLLVSVNPTLVTGVYPTVYTQFSVTLSGLPMAGVNGRVAFRYFVTNGGPTGSNSDILSIDDFDYVSSVAASADLAITKTDGVTTATAGGSAIYTITASNAGPSAATGATVADTFPASLTCSTTCVGTGGGTCTAGPFAGNINDTVNLPSGGSVTYTASCSISPSATGSLSNTATVAAPAGVTDPTPGNNSATDTDTLGASADLAITKTDGVTTVTAGGATTYTITASNSGPSNATGATVADTFPASLTCTWTCTGAAGGTCTASGSGNINNSVNLPSGGSVTYTASCTISGAATGMLSNTATVTAPAGVTDPTPGNNSATDSDTIGASADLSITKTDGVTTATAGGSVTYTITASNAGPSNATGATVADTFPAPLTCTWTCTGAGGGTCTASGSGNINGTVNLPSGGSVTYTASCTVSASATGMLSNTATVTAPAGVTDPTPGNNSATDTDSLGASADLSITKTDGVTTATPGGSVTYTITASNAGPSNATGATVADTFPAPLTCTYTCVGTGGGTCTASGSGNINGTVNLPAGGSVTYTASCSVSASATGTLSNTATVTAPAGVTDPTPGNNSATDTDTLTPQANLGITKTNGTTSVTAGGSTTYTITASNPGPSNAPGSTVADTFPAPLTCTWTCTGAGGGTCGAAAGSGNINDTANLPSGGSVTYTASCSVSASATGTISNTATVTAPAGVTDPVPGNNSATDTDTVISITAPTIAKAFNPTSIFTGGSSTVTLTLTNPSVTAQTNASFTDTLTGGLSAVGGAVGGTCVGTTPTTLAVGATALSFSGITIPGSGSCTVTFAVTSSTAGTKTNQTSGVSTTQVPAAGSPSNTATLLVNTRPTGSISDPFGCTGPGDVLNVTLVLTNSANVTQTVAATATPSAGLAVLTTATPVSSVGTVTASFIAGQLVVTGSLAAGQAVTINYQVQVGDAAPGATLTISTTASFNGAAPLTITAGTINVTCLAVGPGVLYPSTSEVSDQKAGSVLIYNYYTSDIAAAGSTNTRLTLTNTNVTQPIAVHLFFVDGATCSVADAIICLTQNQTVSLLASDYDPGTSGYVVAVASDLVTGCPISFNFLIGDEFVKSGGFQANLGAEAIAALAGGLPLCTDATNAVALNFDGVSYNRLPRVLAADNIADNASGNQTQLIINRIGGDLMIGASRLGTLFGVLYDDIEQTYSFSLPGGVCQLRGTISGTFPRTTPRVDQVIPAGRSGWLKLYDNSSANAAILGAQLVNNANVGASANAFRGGHNLHKLTLAPTSSITIPVFPPNCR